MEKNILRLMVIFCSFLLGGCGDETDKGAIELVNAPVASDCNFWLERNKSALRAGIAGPCHDLSLSDYASALTSAISEAKANGLNPNDIDLIYVNVHEDCLPIGKELIGIINKADSWSEDCVRERLDSCFTAMNQEFSYFKEVEEIVRVEVGSDFDLTFKGIQCMSVDALRKLGISFSSPLKYDCYPTSFGLAIFHR